MSMSPVQYEIFNTELRKFGLLTSVLLLPVYMVWIRFTDLLGWINTRIIIGLIFYMVIVPFIYTLL
jgi:hypothetical protein